MYHITIVHKQRVGWGSLPATPLGQVYCVYPNLGWEGSVVAVGGNTFKLILGFVTNRSMEKVRVEKKDKNKNSRQVINNIFISTYKTSQLIS